MGDLRGESEAGTGRGIWDFLIVSENIGFCASSWMLSVGEVSIS